MQLTQFTDYSLRALIFITLKQQTCTITEIAQAYGISQHHLTKIIHNLSKLGIIKTVRGRNGGISLAVDAQSLNLKTLILQLEPHFDIVPCFNVKKQNCCIAPSCKLKRVLHDAQRAFFKVLEQVTLADVLENKQDLQGLLGL
ncbi:MAG: Rrf2 family transcriptional regulator [Gammaproteobacteria bacterium]|nr:Rrf2 family transcriptional regulator [Gammaproteobacteria bacterium]